jgi:hypothetical protein
MGGSRCFPGLALNLDPPDLSLLSTVTTGVSQLQRAEVLNLNEVTLSNFSFKDHAFGVVSEKSLPNQVFLISFLLDFYTLKFYI